MLTANIHAHRQHTCSPQVVWGLTSMSGIDALHRKHTHTHTHPTAQEAGFKDFKTLRSDPDLRVLREQDGEVRTPSHTRAGQQARVSSFDVL